MANPISCNDEREFEVVDICCFSGSPPHLANAGWPSMYPADNPVRFSYSPMTLAPHSEQKYFGEWSATRCHAFSTGNEGGHRHEL